MKDMGKYVLVGLGAALLCFVWAAFCFTYLNGSTREVGVMLGIGMFLSFEMVILTGVILSRLKKK